MSEGTPTAPTPDGHVWYFAYGSNMARAVFVGNRGIQPLETARVRLCGWTLAFDIPGMPYKEPLFASIRELSPSDRDRKKPEVVGVAYLLTQKQYTVVLGTEGGGVMYAGISLTAVPVDKEDAGKTGDWLTVHTLRTAFSLSHTGKPSRRYMDHVLDGSTESRLPLGYHEYLAAIPTYVPPRSLFRRLGAGLFLMVWMPVVAFAHGLVDATVGSDGDAPALVKVLVRVLFMAMWAWHDYVHSPIWGRGDGAGQDEGYY